MKDDMYNNMPLLKLPRDRRNHITKVIDSTLSVVARWGTRQSSLPPNSRGVLLIASPCWGVDAPPLGIAYVASYLESHGIPVTVLDLNIDLYTYLGPKKASLWQQEKYRLWERIETFQGMLLPLFQRWLMASIEQTVSLRPAAVCFSVSAASVLFSLHFARHLKARIPEVKTIFGGPQCQFCLGDSYLPPAIKEAVSDEPSLVDAIIIGEGEVSALQTVLKILRSERLSRIPGVVTREDRMFRHYLPRQPAKQLDDLGFPSFVGFPLDKYQSTTLPLLLSRGCRTRSCQFCNEYQFYSGFRARSAAHVFGEITQHQDNYGVQSFVFHDLAVNGDTEVLASLADMIAASTRQITWSGQAVVNPTLASDTYVCQLKRGGLCRLVLGVETFSEKVHRLMGKPYQPAILRSVLKTLHSNGVEVVVNLIVGFPGETERDFRNSMEGLKSCERYITAISSVSECHVSPGCKLERNSDRFGVLLQDVDPDTTWLCVGNDHRERLRRLEEALETVSQLGMSYYKKNLYNEVLGEPENHRNHREQER